MFYCSGLSRRGLTALIRLCCEEPFTHRKPAGHPGGWSVIVPGCEATRRKKESRMLRLWLICKRRHLEEHWFYNDLQMWWLDLGIWKQANVQKSELNRELACCWSLCKQRPENFWRCGTTPKHSIWSRESQGIGPSAGPPTLSTNCRDLASIITKTYRAAG